MPQPAGKTIHVKGIIQGVGFRPFVAALARRFNLTGDVLNSTDGVRIRVFGQADKLNFFTKELRSSPPPLAKISSFNVMETNFETRKSFTIIHSENFGKKSVAVTPDAAICADCRHELLSPSDRRHNYPFINCTQCGPRYTILLDVPYDRVNTTMREFEMCDKCQSEYEEPTSRRYHAQPNCCDKCGPHLSLVDSEGNSISEDVIRSTVKLVKAGKIIAIKGLGGFHLACDATDNNAVNRLRQRKNRDEKPFAIMVKNFQEAERLAKFPSYARQIMESAECPILVGEKNQKANTLANAIAPENNYIGIMLPYTPLHIILFEHEAPPLVMTSANRSDEPIVINNVEALDRLSGIADAFLLHDRKINIRVDDSVVLASPSRPTIIRRARGYVPVGIECGLDVSNIAAFGPFLKNTFALGRGSEIFVSQHIGDLENRLALDMWKETYEHMKSILGISPETVTCDTHPDYPTTRMAEESGLPVIKVQHHFAHLLSLMAEHKTYERAIGIAFDGTGYGDDGAVWGGEIFTFSPSGYKRNFHLEYVPMPGGDNAAKEPWRMAISHLFQNGLDWRGLIDNKRAAQVEAILKSGMQLPQTSSMGRLFDAISALIGLAQVNTYQAKAPMQLQSLSSKNELHYPFELDGQKIRTGKVIKSIISDRKNKTPTADIASRFHNTIVQIILRCAEHIHEAEGLRKVFLSGGVFMNSVLVERTKKLLNQNDFEVYTHSMLPPNDGCIAAGQLVRAAWLRGNK